MNKIKVLKVGYNSSILKYGTDVIFRNGDYRHNILSDHPMHESFEENEKSFKDIQLSNNPFKSIDSFNNMLVSFWKEYVPEKAQDSAIDIATKYFLHQDQLLLRFVKKYVNIFEIFLDKWCTSNGMNKISINNDVKIDLSFNLIFEQNNKNETNLSVVKDDSVFSCKLSITRKYDYYIDPNVNNEEEIAFFNISINTTKDIELFTKSDISNKKIIVANVINSNNKQYISKGFIFTCDDANDVDTIQKYINSVDYLQVSKICDKLLYYNNLPNWFEIIFNYIKNQLSNTLEFDINEYLIMCKEKGFGFTMNYINKKIQFQSHPLILFESSSEYFKEKFIIAKNIFHDLDDEISDIILQFNTNKNIPHSFENISKYEKIRDELNKYSKLCHEEFQELLDKCNNSCKEIIRIRYYNEDYKEIHSNFSYYNSHLKNFEDKIRLDIDKYELNGKIDDDDDDHDRNYQIISKLIENLNTAKSQLKSCQSLSNYSLIINGIKNFPNNESLECIRLQNNNAYEYLKTPILSDYQIYNKFITIEGHQVYDAITNKNLEELNKCFNENNVNPNIIVSYSTINGPISAFEEAAKYSDINLISCIMKHELFQIKHYNQFYRAIVFSASNYSFNHLTESSRFISFISNITPSNNSKNDCSDYISYTIGKLCLSKSPKNGSTSAYTNPENIKLYLWLANILINSTNFDPNSCIFDGKTLLMKLLNDNTKDKNIIMKILNSGNINVHKKDKNKLSAFMYASKGINEDLWILEAIINQEKPTNNDIDEAHKLATSVDIKNWLKTIKKRKLENSDAELSKKFKSSVLCISEEYLNKIIQSVKNLDFTEFEKLQNNILQVSDANNIGIDSDVFAELIWKELHDAVEIKRENNLILDWITNANNIALSIKCPPGSLSHVFNIDFILYLMEQVPVEYQDHDDIVSFIELSCLAGADIEGSGDCGRTPLLYSGSKTSQILLKLGADPMQVICNKDYEQDLSRILDWGVQIIDIKKNDGKAVTGWKKLLKTNDGRNTINDNIRKQEWNVIMQYDNYIHKHPWL